MIAVVIPIFMMALVLAGLMVLAQTSARVVEVMQFLWHYDVHLPIVIKGATSPWAWRGLWLWGRCPVRAGPGGAWPASLHEAR